METLLAAAAHLREKGFEPVPRLYAFKDQVAPYALANVKIGVEGSPASVWHDANPSKGGVPWMNPCSTDAHRYMSALAGELKTAGFSLVLLDGVQFPDREYSADYGSSELAGLPRGQVLSRFVGGDPGHPRRRPHPGDARPWRRRGMRRNRLGTIRWYWAPRMPPPWSGRNSLPTA